HPYACGPGRNLGLGRGGRPGRHSGAPDRSPPSDLRGCSRLAPSHVCHLVSDSRPLLGYNPRVDVGRPAGLIMPPGTEAVLRVLGGTDAPMGIRQVARVAGVSANRASQVLSELADHGLVLVEEHG